MHFLPWRTPERTEVLTTRDWCPPVLPAMAKDRGEPPGSKPHGDLEMYRASLYLPPHSGSVETVTDTSKLSVLPRGQLFHDRHICTQMSPWSQVTESRTGATFFDRHRFNSKWPHWDSSNPYTQSIILERESFFGKLFPVSTTAPEAGLVSQNQTH